MWTLVGQPKWHFFTAQKGSTYLALLGEKDHSRWCNASLYFGQHREANLEVVVTGLIASCAIKIKSFYFRPKVHAPGARLPGKPEFKRKAAGGHEVTFYSTKSGHYPVLEPGVKTCAHCQAKNAKMQRCGRCYRTYYCGPQCQAKDWKAHQKCCQPVYVFGVTRKPAYDWDLPRGCNFDNKEDQVINSIQKFIDKGGLGEPPLSASSETHYLRIFNWQDRESALPYVSAYFRPISEAGPLQGQLHYIRNRHLRGPKKNPSEDDFTEGDEKEIYYPVEVNFTISGHFFGVKVSALLRRKVGAEDLFRLGE